MLIPARPAGIGVDDDHAVGLFVSVTVTVIGPVGPLPTGGGFTGTTSYWPKTLGSVTMLPLLSWPLPQLITAEKKVAGIEGGLGSNVATMTPVAGWFATTDAGTTTRFVTAPDSNSAARAIPQRPALCGDAACRRPADSDPAAPTLIVTHRCFPWCVANDDKMDQSIANFPRSGIIFLCLPSTAGYDAMHSCNGTGIDEACLSVRKTNRLDTGAKKRQSAPGHDRAEVLSRPNRGKGTDGPWGRLSSLPPLEMVPPMSAHLCDERISRLLQGTLPDDELVQAEDHLWQCPECRDACSGGRNQCRTCPRWAPRSEHAAHQSVLPEVPGYEILGDSATAAWASSTGPGSSAQPPGGPQDDPRLRARHAQRPAALPDRDRSGGPVAASAYRAAVRGRRGAGPAVLLAGVLRRRHARQR